MLVTSAGSHRAVKGIVKLEIRKQRYQLYHKVLSTQDDRMGVPFISRKDDRELITLIKRTSFLRPGEE